MRLHLIRSLFNADVYPARCLLTAGCICRSRVELETEGEVEMEKERGRCACIMAGVSVVRISNI